MNVSEDLKQQAVGCGLCEEWTESWKNHTLEELVDKYIDGIDFCIKHDYPTVNYIKQHFGEVAEKKGVYADKKGIELHNPPKFVILNGCSEANITVDDFHVCTIFVRHESELNLTVSNNAKVFVRVYDDSAVVINGKDQSKTFVYQYGGEVVEAGNVVVKDKR